MVSMSEKESIENDRIKIRNKFIFQLAISIKKWETDNYFYDKFNLLISEKLLEKSY